MHRQKQSNTEAKATARGGAVKATTRSGAVKVTAREYAKAIACRNQSNGTRKLKQPHTEAEASTRGS